MTKEKKSWLDKKEYSFESNYFDLSVGCQPLIHQL